MATLVPRAGLQPTSMQMPSGAVAHLIVEHLSDLLARADAVLTRDRFTDETFTKLDSYRLPTQETLRETADRVRGDIDRFAERFPDRTPLADSFAHALELAQSADRGLEAVGAGYRTALEAFGDGFEPTASAPRAHSIFTDDGLDVHVRIEHERFARPEQDFLAAVSELIAHRRDHEDNLTVDERIAVRAAYWLLDQGVRIPGPYPIWGASGFRDVQTYASITDPGEGHLAGTTRYPGYLHGVIVHVEHLERGISRSREELEPYRIPSPRVVARVRLHAGRAAPTSSYIGRPLLDGAVEDSLIKTTRTFAAAASSLLSDGLAEVKLSVERLTAAQAIRLLSALAHEVRRDRHAQILAGAFNINTPILDDRDETIRAHGEPISATTPEEIGLLGIEIAARAGLDKVTWDGTADTYPSRCITDQLGAPLALTLVHRAHEVGLLTYFSAGFRFDSLPDAVVTGVDGIGIGGAQILRFMDKRTGNHGPFLPGNIHRILAVRDEAAATPAGLGARLLARLDRLHFEGALSSGDEPRRIALFEALRDGDTVEAERVIGELRHILDLPGDAIHPLLAWASRLLDGGDSLLARQRIGCRQWGRYLSRIRRAAEHADLVRLADLLHQASSRAVPSETTAGC
ncbi:hypothetical protein M3T53_08510 [Actinomyces sp. B33]|uniref:hypothetical protein n=1 Tax=Actinomyces sp. B33 TaxID=2942131 RepID=UPI002340E0E5|nr:hypothetical protein [Actinomyces sp. B33]MDC4233744.1 hypothetical protein [Actinomyces sp. B33]